MNLQANIPGKISGQVPNQAGSELPTLVQRNGNALSHTPNLGISSHSTINMDPEFLRARSFMQEKM